MLGVVDLAVADFALATFDQAPLALAVCWQSLIQIFVKFIQRLLYPCNVISLPAVVVFRSRSLLHEINSSALYKP